MKRGSYYRVLLALMPALAGAMILPGLMTQGSGSAASITPAANNETSVQQQMDRVRLPQQLVSRANARPDSPYSGYVKVTDSFAAITIDVPKEWTQIETGDWNYQGRKVGRFIAASTDLGAFYKGGTVPGVLFGASAQLLPDYNQVALDLNQRVPAAACNRLGSFDYQDMFYQGLYDYYADCARGAANLLVLTALPTTQDYMSMLRISATSKRDLEAIARIFATFQVIGSVDHDNHHH